MKISRVALFVPFLLVPIACGSDNDNKPDAHDASLDRIVTTDTGTHADATVDMAVDAPADVAPPVDAPVDAPKAPHFARTTLTVDQLPDGGAGADAGASDGGDAATGPFVDPNLINPWGLAFNPAGPIWVADNGTGLSTVYTSSGAPQALVVTVPPPTGGTPPSAPTGLVFNATTFFMGDKFIFSSEDGTIVGWQTGTTATLRVDNSTTNAVYKGLAMADRNNISRLYATDFHNGKVVAFDAAYNKITTTGGFVDPSLPAGFAPFGIAANGSVIFVTYAKQNAEAHDDVAGVGNGYVDVFDFDGVFTKRLISTGMLNSPWGLAMAPADFGGFPHALIVGNFGDGHINAYDATSGSFLGNIDDALGAPITLPGLWSLVFGNDTAGAAHDQLFFTAGGAKEDHGTLGRIDFVP